jgi:hypothetical protein
MITSLHDTQADRNWDKTKKEREQQKVPRFAINLELNNEAKSAEDVF